MYWARSVCCNNTRRRKKSPRVITCSLVSLNQTHVKTLSTSFHQMFVWFEVHVMQLKAPEKLLNRPDDDDVCFLNYQMTFKFHCNLDFLRNTWVLCVYTDIFQIKRRPRHLKLNVSHHVFKDEGQWLSGVDDVMEDDDVGVFQTFEQRGCAHTHTHTLIKNYTRVSATFKILITPK